MRECIAAIFIIAGLFVFVVSLLGIFRLKYVLNRMHAAALGDTLGLGLIAIGLMIMGINLFHSLKYLLIILFFWMSGPVATHMIAKVELLTNIDYEGRTREK